MLLSAVILSFDSAAHLDTAVRSLAAECARLPGPCEVVVVDNGSRDGSVALLRRLEAEFASLLRVIRLPVNLGTTVSRNMALRGARGRFVLVMDSDVEVPAGCLVALLPRLVHRDGRPQLSADMFPTITRKLARFFGLRRIEAALPGDEGGPRRVDYAISAFWLMRREVLERVGLLDERIFYSPEDVDYCLRVWAAGYEVVLDDAATAIHDAREVSRGLRNPRFLFSHALGLAYLFAKHRYAFGRTRLYRRLGMAGHGA
jgi:GT2 family glycosyltransferase